MKYKTIHNVLYNGIKYTILVDTKIKVKENDWTINGHNKIFIWGKVRISGESFIHKIIASSPALPDFPLLPDNTLNLSQFPRLYSEDDLKKAFDTGRIIGIEQPDYPFWGNNFNKFVASLKPEYYFEVEEVESRFPSEQDIIIETLPKILNNTICGQWKLKT